ncbi:hypothetical protein BJ912DRAFT_1133803 [Pholiota molesta]|nr:hypothetical protein BJ912DRAFT_1133803 [Pholiota molesta]
MVSTERNGRCGPSPPAPETSRSTRIRGSTIYDVATVPASQSTGSARSPDIVLRECVQVKRNCSGHVEESLTVHHLIPAASSLVVGSWQFGPAAHACHNQMSAHARVPSSVQPRDAILDIPSFRAFKVGSPEQGARDDAPTSSPHRASYQLRLPHRLIIRSVRASGRRAGWAGAVAWWRRAHGHGRGKHVEIQMRVVRPCGAMRTHRTLPHTRAVLAHM